MEAELPQESFSMIGSLLHLPSPDNDGFQLLSLHPAPSLVQRPFPQRFLLFLFPLIAQICYFLRSQGLVATSVIRSDAEGVAQCGALTSHTQGSGFERKGKPEQDITARRLGNQCCCLPNCLKMQERKALEPNPSTAHICPDLAAF